MTSPVNNNNPNTSGPVTAANAIDETSLAAGDYTKTIILNNIFNLLIGMVNSLQNVAAAQANRLNFLTEWQKAYTDMQNQLHTFVQFNGDGIQGSGSTSSNERDDLNRVNSTYTQELQNKQSVISDDAKALQSNVNQSNSAVNDQSNLATSIIQEMSTILNIMFQSS